MRALISKFTQHEDLRRKLLDTGDAKLVEHTTRDRYWGDGGGEGKGRNRLGVLLMRVRDELKREEVEAEEVASNETKIDEQQQEP